MVVILAHLTGASDQDFVPLSSREQTADGRPCSAPTQLSGIVAKLALFCCFRVWETCVRVGVIAWSIIVLDNVTETVMCKRWCNSLVNNCTG